MDIEKATLAQLIELASRRSSGIAYEGHTCDDQNTPGNILIIESQHAIFSFSKSDVLEKENLSAGRTRVWVRVGSNAYRLSSFVVGNVTPFFVGMEELSPPPPREDPNAPIQARPGEYNEAIFPGAGTLSGVASVWTNSCTGGDSYDNNCAHFLSDAFIRAGFTELLPPNPYINARCSASAKRPIRARDMWNWFQSKGVSTSRTVTRNTGWWAIFQLNESTYWGGHVVVLDSNNWQYYGTGYYGDWNQYLYQW
jgi:hypothetical protein